MKMSKLALLAVFIGIFVVLAAGQGPDLRERLLKSATRAKDFPDGKSLQLTHFAYVGKTKSKKGVVYIVDLRSVVTGMPAPRGVNAILFFDSAYRYLGRESYVSSSPLWCEGGKLYLFGDLDGNSEKGVGNVIDLSEGFARRRVYKENKYGSSGGI